MAKKNITVQIEEAILKQSRHLAVEDDKSLSEWVGDLVVDAVKKRSGREASKRRAAQILKAPLKLGGAVFSRDTLHER